MIDQAGILMAQGASIACERIRGVNDNMMQSHSHDYYEIYFLEKGERFHRLEEKLLLLHSSDFILFSPGTLHFSYGAEDVPFCRIVLYFRKSEISNPEIAKSLDSSNGIYVTDDANEKRFIQRTLDEIMSEQKNRSKNRNECMRLLLNLLLLHIDRNNCKITSTVSENNERLEEIISFIHLHFAEDINLDTLAKKFSLSTFHLCRSFKKYTNSTLVQYINTTRVMNAQRRFMETNKNVTEVSIETGFSSLTHFNRVFKSVTGTSPSQYRSDFFKNKSHR